MRPQLLPGGQGLHTGFLMEQAGVVMVDKRTIGLGRKAQGEYQPGRQVVLRQGGLLVPATVVRAKYDSASSRTQVVLNASVDASIQAVYLDASSPHCGGNDEKTFGLFHFEDNQDNAALYDASLGATYKSGTGNVTVYGILGAPLSTAQKKFGTKSLNLPGTGMFCLNSFPIAVASAWTIEGYFYGRPVNGIFSGYYWRGDNFAGGGSWGQTTCAVAFDGNGKPYFSSYSAGTHQTNDSFSLVGSTALNADDWNHVAWTYDLTTLMILLNGIPIGSLAKASSAIYGTPFGCIGGQYCNNNGSIYGGSYLTCFVDEVRFSNRCLYNTDFTLPNRPFGPDAR